MQENAEFLRVIFFMKNKSLINQKRKGNSKDRYDSFKKHLKFSTYFIKWYRNTPLSELKLG